MTRKRRWILLLLAIIALVPIAIFILAQCAAVHHARVAGEGIPDKWVVSNVRIVDLNGNNETDSPSDILVNNGVIEEIVPHGSKKFNVKVIDGSEKYVTPGLIDSHAHIEDSAYLGLSLSYGVTTVRGMRGYETQLRWRDEINDNKWLGSRFYVASPIIDGQPGDPFHTVVQSPPQAKKLIKKYADEGYDLIKLYGNVEGDVFDQIIITAGNNDIPVAKHGPFPAVDKPLSSLHPLQSLEHIEDIYSTLLNHSIDDQGFVTKRLKELAILNVPIVSTLSVFDELTRTSQYKSEYIETLPLAFFNKAHLQLTTLFGVNRWLNASLKVANRNANDFENLKVIVKQLHDLGALIVLGSDSGALLGVPGYSTHRELQLLIDSGLAHKAALRSATINPAKMLGMENRLGQIKAGFVADFIVSDDDPLLNIRTLEKPHAVSFQGMWLDGDKLEALKMNATHTLPIWLTYPMLFWQITKEYYDRIF